MKKTARATQQPTGYFCSVVLPDMRRRRRWAKQRKRNMRRRAVLSLMTKLALLAFFASVLMMEEHIEQGLILTCISMSWFVLRIIANGSLDVLDVLDEMKF